MKNENNAPIEETIVKNKVAIVTGGSSGIGLEAAKALSAAGCQVYEFSRKDIEFKDIAHMSVDVTDEKAVIKAVKTIIEIEGKIDILVNCAGFGISGAIEFTTIKSAQKQMDVNFFGMCRCTKAVLGYMREARSGRIVNISSIAGPIPIPFQAFYSASKTAVMDYTCALANEVRPFGITCCAVLPGDTRTGFTAAREKSIDGDLEYGGRIEKSVKVMEKDEANGTDPKVTGGLIAKVALKKNVKPYYSVGFKNQFFYVVMKLLPIRLANWILYQIYGK